MRESNCKNASTDYEESREHREWGNLRAGKFKSGGIRERGISRAGEFESGAIREWGNSRVGQFESGAI